MSSEKGVEHCSFLRVQNETARRVAGCMPSDEMIYDLAELFKVFGDVTRVKILLILMEAELCVGDMAQLLEVSQNAVSHQLRVLKNSKLVKFRREGKIIFYSLADEHVRRIIRQGVEHLDD